MTKRLDPIPPGEILLEEFMKPLGVSRNRLARDIDVGAARINDIVHPRRCVSASTLKLHRSYGWVCGWNTTYAAPNAAPGPK